MIVINLFGGPGSGKSVAAAEIFSILKIHGHNAELVTEYAKDMVWEKRENVLQDQLYILAKQNRRIQRLENTVDVVVTDSPIIMGLVYTDQNYFPSFGQLVKEIYDSYNNVNFFLKRPKHYMEIGRNQTFDEATKIDEQILNLLIDHELPFTVMDMSNDRSKQICQHSLGDKFDYFEK